ncbi:MAG: hypothetical protein P8Y47_08625 [Alphaproteobacteria bacterium]
MFSIGTILSIVGGVSEAISIAKLFGSTLAKGDDSKRVLNELGGMRTEIKRLSDNILYAPSVEGLRDTTGAAHRPIDLRDVRSSLEPVQAALGEEIVSSGLIATPDKMECAMLANPWAVLEDIRPQHLAVRPSNPDKAPVLFEHNGVRYIGWQMRGALPQLFDCELHDLPGLGTSLTPSTPSISSMKLPPISNSTGSELILPPPAPTEKLRIEGPDIGKDTPSAGVSFPRQQNTKQPIQT